MIRDWLAREMKMQSLIEQFFEFPSSANYLLVRDVVKRHATYRPLTVELFEIKEKIERAQFERAMRAIEDLLPGCTLSPRLHSLAALTARSLGDLELEELEQFMFQACLQGIVATGDGESENPYVTTHASDVHDVLQTLQVPYDSQRVGESFGEMCDVISTCDGRRIWFVVERIRTVPGVVARQAEPMHSAIDRN